MPFLLCLTLYLRAIFQVQAPWGDLTEGFFALPVHGAYAWRGLFSEFYDIQVLNSTLNLNKMQQILAKIFHKNINLPLLWYLLQLKQFFFLILGRNIPCRVGSVALSLTNVGSLM